VAARTLNQRDLNRAVLARQLLLERAGAPLPRALERMGCLQAQYAPSMYVGLWSRLEGFDRDALTRALGRRTVVQGTLMRQTIHLVSARDWWPLAVAVREARRESWLRSHRGGPDAREMASAARRLRARIADGPMPRAEVDELVGHGAVGVNGVGLWLDLVRVPPSGTWERRRADLYAAAEDWLGPEAVERADAVEHLVRRYLAGFGPAPAGDIADWGGLGVKELAPALERMPLRRFRDEQGAELLDLPRAPLPDPDTPAPVRFLPTWDASLLAHARRTGILPEEHRPKVFSTRTPQSGPTFLVDGAVAGTWRFERGRVKLEPFERLDRATRRELDDEAERLAELHA
jgi:Winged helix DNA-binding domain